MVEGVLRAVRLVLCEEGKNNWPNKISILRIVLTPLICWFIWQNKIQLAVVFFIVAAITDAFDGWYARKYEQETRLGVYLDPIADKIFVIAVSGILLLRGLWLITFLIIFIRELFVFFGRLLVANTEKEKVVTVTWRGKSKAITQYIGLGYSILAWPYFNWVMLIVVIITIWSGVDYYLRLRKAMINKNNENHV